MGCKIIKGVAAREINGKYYIVLPKEMKLVKLNKTGSYIFGLMLKGMVEDKILQMLVEKYGVTPVKAKKDLAGFIKELKNSKISE